MSSTHAAPDAGRPPAAGGQVQAATLDMARSVLMALGSPLIAKGLVTGDQWTAVAGGVLAATSAVWSYAAAHPGRAPPLQALRGLVKGAGQGPAWNADVATLERIVTPLVERAIDNSIKSRVGLFAVPAEALADKAVRSAADDAAEHLTV
jgi:hypothetical protein